MASTPDTPAPTSDLQQVLSSGDGHAFLSLSHRDRLALGILIERTVGQHSGYEYFEFLTTFYSDAKAENPALLSRPISEVAAVAAASEFGGDTD